MIMAALFGTLVGAVLGTRFRVQVLLPAGVLGVAGVLAIAMMRGSFGLALAAALAYLPALQFGYLGGLFTRYAMVIGRTAWRRSLRSKAVQA
jgi:hypothetical protein